MKLTWGRLARHDLKEIVSYIAEDSLYAAELVATRILKTAGMLREMPRIGRTGRVQGTRELLVLRTPLSADLPNFLAICFDSARGPWRAALAEGHWSLVRQRFCPFQYIA